MLKILTVPNSILSKPTKKVERFDASLQLLIKEMDKTLACQINPQGVGLAAPQVGNDLSVFVIKPTPESKTEAFVNPRIIKKQTVEDGKWKIEKEDRKSRIEKNSIFHPQSSNSTVNPQSSTVKRQKKASKLEGCLSIPKIWGGVKRANKILLQYQDLTGKSQKKWFSSFKAVIIQHEVDHLSGVLFTQRALEQNTQLFEEKDGELMPLRFQNAKA